MKNEDELPDAPMSDDPEESLRMENELLRLKMKAELGAEPFKISDDLDPEIENHFLKNVLAFEHNFAITKPAKVYDLIGRPEFKESAELDDAMIIDALEWVIDLLSEKNIEVYFGDDYDKRTQYHFITEELFAHETTLPPMPGMVTHFDYEEFHPNHKKDIERATTKFLSGWLERSIEECSWQLGGQAILPDKKILSKAEVLSKIKNIFAAYTSFSDSKQGIFDIGFDLEVGMGHAEGGLKYSAVLENGDTTGFGGPFKLYFSLEHGYWAIVYMVLPGFEY